MKIFHVVKANYLIVKVDIKKKTDSMPRTINVNFEPNQVKTLGGSYEYSLEYLFLGYSFSLLVHH